MRKIKKIALISPSVMLSERELNSDLWMKYFMDLGLEVVITPTALSGKYLDTFQAKDEAPPWTAINASTLSSLYASIISFALSLA